MSMRRKGRSFKHVDYLWQTRAARKFNGDEIELFLYRSNLLGADLRITNYGGGNTSCKTVEKDPLTGTPVEVMWVKGSGGDLGTLNREGIAGLYLDKLRSLKQAYRGPEHEDAMVKMYYHCLFDLDSRAPSIDTALHALLPYPHIDHLHPDAVIAVAASKNSRNLTRKIWDGALGWIPWQRPGYDLALKLEECLHQNPGIRGILLAGHGLFTWGETSHACYNNSLEVIETAASYLNNRIRQNKSVFGGSKRKSDPAARRRKKAAFLGPLLRGFCSSNNPMVGHFTDDPRVLEFINSKHLRKLAPMGTSCPDHFLRTKIQPLVLSVPDEIYPTIIESLKPKIRSQFEQYRSTYADYYKVCRHQDSPAMRDPNPVVILYPGVGMFTFAKNKQTARVAAEFYINAINVMRGAEAISKYTALSRQEAFNIEYWQLEEDKLRRQPTPKPLSGKVAFITGAGGGIGKAVALKLVAEGACVFLTDINQQHLTETMLEFTVDAAASAVCDVTNPKSIRRAFAEACRAFGGVDILVHSAGLAISKSLLETTESDWEVLQNVLVKGQFLVTQEAVRIMRTQDLGGDIINIASKNGIASGPNNVGYGTAKAAQQHMTRLLAAELGASKIRVNTINPDGVIVGSRIWQGTWAEGRAKAHNIRVDELPEHYGQRNLLGEIILPKDVADAVFSFVAILNKTTGATLSVDGGMTSAFVR